MMYRRLTDKGWNRFCEFLAEVGNEKVISNFFGYSTSQKATSSWREDLHMAINEGGEVIGFEIRGQFTASKNPEHFFMDNEDWVEIELENE